MGTLRIPISQGKFVLIDDVDAERICPHRWFLHPRGYACRHRKANDGPGPSIILMHREIMNALPGTNVDHRNRDRLDNRRLNLRFATASQNRMNSVLSKNNSSGFRGVSWDKSSRGWRARIGKDGAYLYLGTFPTAQAAAEAYAVAAKTLAGDFVCLKELKRHVIE